MAKYKVLEDFNLNGIIQKKDTIIELDFVKANLNSIKKMIELAKPEDLPPVGGVLGTIVPGQPLTEEQKEKLRKENEEITKQAHAMAAEQQARDIAEGRGAPPVTEVADMLKEKLTNEEFTKKDGADVPPPMPEEVPPVQ